MLNFFAILKALPNPWANARRGPRSRPQERFRPQIEMLEDRSVPTVYTVNTISDTVAADGFLSLREAIQAADSNHQAGSATSADIIQFDPSLDGKTITLSGTELPITANLAIVGPGAEKLTISGDNLSRIFHLTGTANGVTVSISGLTLTAGKGADGGAVEGDLGQNDHLVIRDSVITNSKASATGGAIALPTGGHVWLEDDTIANNSATGNGGAISVRGGAAGNLTVVDSTITENKTTGGLAGGIDFEGNILKINFSTLSANQVVAAKQGGAVYVNRGTDTIADSTFNGNTTAGQGGAIFVDSTATLLVANSTITANSSTGTGTAGGGGGIFDNSTGKVRLINDTIDANHAANSTGGGIQLSAGSVALLNTIVADDTDATSTPDLKRTGGTLNAYYSLIQTGQNAINGKNRNNIFGEDPLLGELQDNGGSTFTQALLAGSPAVDAGDDALVRVLATDQRGGDFGRIVGLAVDIGAFEVQSSALSGGSWNN